METYKVKIAWEGVKVGDIFKQTPNGVERTDEDGITAHYLSCPLLAVLIHLGFIEEVGAVKKKFVPEVGEKYWCVDERCEIEWFFNDNDY